MHPVTEERIDDWLAFFDHDAFADNRAWAACYCAEPHLRAKGEPPDLAEARSWRDNREVMERRLRRRRRVRVPRVCRREAGGLGQRVEAGGLRPLPRGRGRRPGGHGRGRRVVLRHRTAVPGPRAGGRPARPRRGRRGQPRCRRGSRPTRSRRARATSAGRGSCSTAAASSRSASRRATWWCGGARVTPACLRELVVDAPTRGRPLMIVSQILGEKGADVATVRRTPPWPTPSPSSAGFASVPSSYRTTAARSPGSSPSATSSAASPPAVSVCSTPASPK